MPGMDLRGATVSWREAGAEAPGAPVLFAHCSLAHSGLWRPLLEALAPERPVVALDLPGHGRSSAQPEGESLQIFAVEAAERLAERFGRPVHLVGLSLGAAVLGRLALRRPDLALSAALFEPVWFHLLRDGGREDAAAEEEGSMAAIGALAEAEGPRAAVREFMERWGMPGGWDRMNAEAQAATAATYGLMAQDFDWVVGRPAGQIFLADLARMRPPTLLVSGERTPRTAAAVADLAAAAIPGARRHVIAGAGHLSPVARPEESLALLRGFWGEAEAKAAA